MARLARIIIPNLPHLVTQRGNRDLDVFFGEDDARAYIDTMAEQTARFGVKIWAWCLLKNRVHFLTVPDDEAGLSRALGETHRRYTNRINEREGWSGHLWQSRFSSFPLDEPYILPAAHYIETMPVMTGLARDPAAFKWSSAKAHLKGENDALCDAAPLLERGYSVQWGHNNYCVPDVIESHIRTGRPLGDASFIEKLETITGRTLKKQKPGRKPKGWIKTNSANNNRLLHRRQPHKPAFKISEQDLAALIDSQYS